MKRKSIIVVITITVLALSLLGVQAAKKVKINKSKATIYVGNTISLKIKNNKKKVKWKSSNKKIASVSKKGKVKGKKVGKATIIAKVGKKKLKCKVNVINTKNNKLPQPTESKVQPESTVVPVTTTESTAEIETSDEVVNPNDWEYEFTESGTAIITAYKGNNTSITFPSEIEGCRVTSIKGTYKTTSESYPNVKNIIMPESITYVDSGAFGGCKQLEKVVLSSRLREIPSHLFYGCVKLKEVNIPSAVKKIGAGAFAYCESITNLTLPDTITEIQSTYKYYYERDRIEDRIEGAFRGCKNLISINIPNRITNISSDSFRECSSLKSIKIPDGVNKIGSSAFQGCSSLESVIMPSEVDTLGGAMFAYCTSLREIRMPDVVRNIQLGTTDEKQQADWLLYTGFFMGCENLVNVTLPASINSDGGVQMNMFRNCKKLSSVDIPDGNNYYYIGEGAFIGCNSLKSIVIPNSVRSFKSPGEVLDSTYDYRCIGSFEKSIILKGKNGSAAQTYANKNGIKFIVIS